MWHVSAQRTEKKIFLHVTTEQEKIEQEKECVICLNRMDMHFKLSCMCDLL